MNADPANPRDNDTPDDLPDRVEDLPAWREPPKAPEIPDVLRRPVEHPSKSPRANQRSPASSLSEAGKAWGMAFDFIGTVLVGILLGWLLGRWLGSMPAFVLGGLALGLVSAFVRIVRATQRAERREAAERERARRGEQPPTAP
ncbi:MAG: AtpZ/AtpI family protein [Phycisphaeraceae bacterium]|nr:AtpZ/AtpI family protein [Phycisphaeraceae bacterium]MBX3407911.1 AtpZ/AtpI family protein [Phycisphaeraceae bacterium]